MATEPMSDEDWAAIEGRIRLHTSWCAIEDRQVLANEVRRLRAQVAPAAGRPELLCHRCEAKGAIPGCPWCRGRQEAFAQGRAAGAALLEDAYRALLSHRDEPSDWACRQCRPHSEILVDGFVCTWHRALAFVRAECGCDHGSCVLPGQHNGPRCRERQGFKWSSDDWCSCRCHREPALDPGSNKGSEHG